MSNTNQKFIISKFGKVAFEDYVMSMKRCFPTYQWAVDQLEELHANIQLPKRSSKNNAGYDFFAPFAFELKPGNKIRIPTGIYVGNDTPWLIVTTPGVNNKGINITIMIEEVMYPPDLSDLKSKNPKYDTTAVKQILADDNPEETSPVDNSGHVIIEMEMTLINRLNFLNGISKFGRDLRNFSKSVKFVRGEAFVRTTMIPYGITLNDEYDEDSEHVDEVKIVPNFVWSEEKYPGSTNPELDGQTVTVMIIDDGITVQYKFSLSDPMNITDEDIDKVLDVEENEDDMENMYGIEDISPEEIDAILGITSSNTDNIAIDEEIAVLFND